MGETSGQLAGDLQAQSSREQTPWRAVKKLHVKASVGHTTPRPARPDPERGPHQRRAGWGHGTRTPCWRMWLPRPICSPVTRTDTYTMWVRDGRGAPHRTLLGERHLRASVWAAGARRRRPGELSPLTAPSAAPAPGHSGENQGHSRANRLGGHAEHVTISLWFHSHTQTQTSSCKCPSRYTKMSMCGRLKMPGGAPGSVHREDRACAQGVRGPRKAGLFRVWRRRQLPRCLAAQFLVSRFQHVQPSQSTEKTRKMAFPSHIPRLSILVKIL